MRQHIYFFFYISCFFCYNDIVFRYIEKTEDCFLETYNELQKQIALSFAMLRITV